MTGKRVESLESDAILDGDSKSSLVSDSIRAWSLLVQEFDVLKATGSGDDMDRIC
jgi:hypothetical protein